MVICTRPVLAGQTVVVGPVPTEEGVEVVARYSTDLVNWTTVPVRDIVRVDGAAFDPVTGAIQGNGWFS